MLANNVDPDQMPQYVASDRSALFAYDPFTGFQANDMACLDSYMFDMDQHKLSC